MVRALVAGGAVAAGLGIALYHLPAEAATELLRGLRPLGYPTGDVLRYVEDAGVRTDTLRAIGTSVDPNVFGAMLLMTGGLAVGQLLAAGGAARRLYAGAAGLNIRKAYWIRIDHDLRRSWAICPCGRGTSTIGWTVAEIDK